MEIKYQIATWTWGYGRYKTMLKQHLLSICSLPCLKKETLHKRLANKTCRKSFETIFKKKKPFTFQQIFSKYLSVKNLVLLNIVLFAQVWFPNVNRRVFEKNSSTTHKFGGVGRTPADEEIVALSGRAKEPLPWRTAKLLTWEAMERVLPWSGPGNQETAPGPWGGSSVSKPPSRGGRRAVGVGEWCGRNEPAVECQEPTFTQLIGRIHLERVPLLRVLEMCEKTSSVSLHCWKTVLRLAWRPLYATRGGVVGKGLQHLCVWCKMETRSVNIWNGDASCAHYVRTPLQLSRTTWLCVAGIHGPLPTPLQLGDGDTESTEGRWSL